MCSVMFLSLLKGGKLRSEDSFVATCTLFMFVFGISFTRRVPNLQTKIKYSFNVKYQLHNSKGRFLNLDSIHNNS